jgi:phosphatidate cytidylyltransferase
MKQDVDYLPDSMNGKLSDLGVRTLSAVVLLGIAIGLMNAGVVGTLILVLAAGSLMLWEWTKIVSKFMRSFTMVGIMTLLYAVSCLSYVFIAPAISFIVLAFGVISCLILNFFKHHRKLPVNLLIWNISGYVLVTLTAFSFLMLRSIPDSGLLIIIWIALVVVGTDIGGYFTGRLIGGPKFAPRISPKKTWSGVVGGWVCAAGMGLIFGWLTDGTYGIPMVILSVIMSMVAQVGDLSESAFKRLFNVKDAGRIIPGHGGVFDRVDGLVAVTLVAAFLTIIRGTSILIW